MKENINHVDMIEMKTSAEKLPSYKLLTIFICSVIILMMEDERQPVKTKAYMTFCPRARSAKNNNNHTISRYIISWLNLHNHKHTKNST
jgi:hypothetical protein